MVPIADWLQEVEQLHHLPVTTLEQQLKRCRGMAPSYHDKVLTPEEMTDYMSWMVSHFSGRGDFQFSTKDISIHTSGNIAALSDQLLQNTEKAGALAQLADILRNPSEKHFFGVEQSVSAGRFLRHLPACWQRSGYFEVYYAFSGRCPVWFEGEELILTPGSVLLVPPNVCKANRCPDDDCVLFFYMIRSSTFSKVFWEQLSNQNLMSLFFRQALGGSSDTAYLRFETDRDPGLEAILYAIFWQYRQNGPYCVQMVNSLMGAFFLYLLQNYEQTAAVSKRSSLHWKTEYSSILIYIQEHFQSVTIEELAKVFGYSSRQIIRIVQNSTGKTFSQLLLQLRMERAADLLTTTDLPADQIGAMAGYSSPSSFYRAFTGYYQAPPGQWKTEKKQ